MDALNQLFANAAVVGLLTLLISQLSVLLLPLIKERAENKRREAERKFSEQGRVREMFQRSLKYVNLLNDNFTGIGNEHVMDFNIQLRDSLSDLYLYLISHNEPEAIKSFEEVYTNFTVNNSQSGPKLLNEILELSKKDRVLNPVSRKNIVKRITDRFSLSR